MPAPDCEGVRAVFGAAVRRERLARGWSLVMLASRAGVGRTTLSAIERLRRGTTLETAELLAGALGTTIGALADGQAVDGRG
jgi:transcriptional regulator with XRE-family HTH domain